MQFEDGETSSDGESSGSPQDEVVTPIAPSDPFNEPKPPLLVNRDSNMPDDYKPDLVSLGNGYLLNRRAATAWEAMRSSARKDSVSIWAISTYRSLEYQENLFYRRIKECMAEGKTSEEAYEIVAFGTAVPGTSEHNLGLAVDINELSESFEKTKAFAWMQENSANFGFILRYPKNKTEITRIKYEPWHYRYIGSNHAKIMKEKGFVLEEYILNISEVSAK